MAQIKSKKNAYFYQLDNGQAVHEESIGKYLCNHWQYFGAMQEHFGRMYVYIGKHWHDQDILVIPVKDLYIKDCCEKRQYHYNKCTQYCIYNEFVISNSLVECNGIKEIATEKKLPVRTRKKKS